MTPGGQPVGDSCPTRHQERQAPEQRSPEDGPSAADRVDSARRGRQARQRPRCAPVHRVTGPPAPVQGGGGPACRACPTRSGVTPVYRGRVSRRIRPRGRSGRRGCTEREGGDAVQVRPARSDLGRRSSARVPRGGGSPAARCAPRVAAGWNVAGTSPTASRSGGVGHRAVRRSGVGSTAGSASAAPCSRPAANARSRSMSPSSRWNPTPDGPSVSLFSHPPTTSRHGKVLPHRSTRLTSCIHHSFRTARPMPSARQGRLRRTH